MRAARNIAIILVLALIVAEVPGGDNLARGLIATITIAFLLIIGAAGYQLYRQNQLTYVGLDDRLRATFLAALGAIALMIAGADELLDTSLGTLVWLSVLGISIYALVRVYQGSRAY